MSEANTITADLLVKIPQRFPSIRLWRQNTGLAFGADSVNAAVKALARGDAKAALEYFRRRPIRFGVPGQGDISGIIGPSGRRLEIEVKAGRDKMSPEQQAFRAMVIDRGGVYIECRDVQTCLGELELACRCPAMSLSEMADAAIAMSRDMYGEDGNG